MSFHVAWSTWFFSNQEFGYLENLGVLFYSYLLSSCTKNLFDGVWQVIAEDHTLGKTSIKAEGKIF